MKKTFALLFIGISLLLIGACAKDTVRPYNPMSTANAAGVQSGDSGLIDYSSYESAINDNSYKQDKVSTQVHPLMSSDVEK